MAKYQDLSSIQVEQPNRFASTVKTDRLAETVLYVPRNSKGKYLLTGCHPEINSAAVMTDLFKDTFHLTGEEQSNLADQLKVHDETKRTLFQSRLNTLKIKTK